jgi:hypothetical protein
MDLADVYRIFHPTSPQYTFFSAAHGTFSKIDHILGHKTSLSKGCPQSPLLFNIVLEFLAVRYCQIKTMPRVENKDLLVQTTRLPHLQVREQQLG